MILNIRGTGGSGKSTLVREIIVALHPPPYHQPGLLADQDGKTIGYQLDQNIRVLGKYPPTGGGADSIGTIEEVEALVRAWAELGHVIFEGYVVSDLYGRWATVAAQLDGFIWAFLDTPEDVSHDRILQRNGGKSINRDRHRQRWKQARRARTKAIAAGFDVRNIRHDHALEDALAIIRAEITPPIHQSLNPL